MTKIKRSGSSVEAVIAAFREEYKVQDWELKYEVVKRPRAGFLGLFASKTAVVSFDVPEIEDRVKLYLQLLLQKMGINYEKIDARREGKIVHLDIQGVSEPGFLIGKNGSMLDTLQYFLNRVFDSDRRLSTIYLDSEGYREKKDQYFLRRFVSRIQETRQSGKPLTLDPMHSSQRRIIHQYVKRQKGLRTLTVGDGDKKRIIVFPTKLSEQEVLSQTGTKAIKFKGKPPRKAAPQNKQAANPDRRGYRERKDKGSYRKPKYYPNRRPPKRGDHGRRTDE
jgi:spoIIIJ-associated protein